MRGNKNSSTWFFTHFNLGGFNRKCQYLTCLFFFFCRKLQSHRKITENCGRQTFPFTKAGIIKTSKGTLFCNTKNNDLIFSSKFAEDIWNKDSVIQKGSSWPSVNLANAAKHMLRGLNSRMWLDSLHDLLFGHWVWEVLYS